MSAILSFLEEGGSILSWRWEGLCGPGLLFKLDGFRAIHLCLTAFLWAASSVFSIDYFRGQARSARFHLFSFLTLFSTAGVFLSGDLFTTFVFFELMSLFSYPMVAHDETPFALRAAETYLAFSLICGMAMLMGLFLLRGLAGTLEMGLLYEACGSVSNRPALYAAGALILAGFGAKAGMFPLHAWLPKTYPAAPAPGSALFSGILSKCGVYGVLVVSCEIFRGDVNWGLALLVPGAITMLLGAVLAVFSTDLKRTLACSSASQIGFIFIGIAMQCISGAHNALAARGTMLHIMNHSLLKLSLFLLAGVVYMNLRSSDLNDMRGFGRGKPLFAFIFLSAAAGISGIPFFNGYISKTLLHEGIVDGIHIYAGGQGYGPIRGIAGLLRIVELLFVFTGGLTVSYMLKLVAALFGHKPIGKKPDDENAKYDKTLSGKRYMSMITAATLSLSAAVPLVLGVFPGLMEFFASLGEGFLHSHKPEHAVHYFDWANLRGALFSLLLGIAVYALFIRKALVKKDESGGVAYLNVWPCVLDLENLIYRPFISGFVFVLGYLAKTIHSLPDAIVALAMKTLLRPLKPGRFPGKFYGKYYYLIYPEEAEKPKTQAAYAGFSVSLLLFGAGLCAMLIYLLFLALRSGV